MLNNLQTQHKLEWVIAYNQTSFAQHLWSEFNKAIQLQRLDIARRIRAQYKKDFLNFNRGS